MMNEYKDAALILQPRQEWRLGGDGEQTNPVELTSAINVALGALNLAADIKTSEVSDDTT